MCLEISRLYDKLASALEFDFFYKKVCRSLHSLILHRGGLGRKSDMSDSNFVRGYYRLSCLDSAGSLYKFLFIVHRCSVMKRQCTCIHTLARMHTHRRRDRDARFVSFEGRDVCSFVASLVLSFVRSLRSSVRPSVRSFVRASVRPSVRSVVLAL